MRVTAHALLETRARENRIDSYLDTLRGWSYLCLWERNVDTDDSGKLDWKSPRSHDSPRIPALGTAVRPSRLPAFRETIRALQVAEESVRSVGDVNEDARRGAQTFSLND